MKRFPANVRPRLLTVVLRAHETDVRRYAKVYLPNATIRAVGRMVAVQHPSFASLGSMGLIDLANGHNLPLVDIVRRSAL